jgi:hypothetical protein
MRCSYYPQSLVWNRGANREIWSWFWRSWPAGAVHPELPKLDRDDWCLWLVWSVCVVCGICLGWVAWLVCLWVVVLLVSSWFAWSCFASFCVGFFLPCRLCFGGVFIPGPRQVIEALWNICCVATVDTGLTGSVHRSDRHRPSVWPV